jgi:hypothetical protein
MVDIDGVLSLFGFPPHAPPEGSWHFVEGIPHFLSAAAARHLLALVSLFELVWCSGWEEKADEHLPHLLGLPRGLPHLSFERGADRTEDADEARATEVGAAGAGWGTGGASAGGADPAAGKSLHGHWKLSAIDVYARGRPLAWIDDCIDAACHAWAAARGAPTLLVQTQPDIGLTAADAEALARWAPYPSTSGTSSSASSSTKPGSESPAPIFSSDARSASNSWP